MTPQIGLLGAFLGGLLTLVSPCSALLLPSFFAYAFDRMATLLLRTAAFYVGLLAVLVPLGAGVGAVGAMLTRYRTTMTTIGGIVLIALGIAIAAGKGFSVPAADALRNRLRPGSTLSVLALGAVYGLAGFCSGPLLGSVLTVSAAGGSAAYGGLLMGLYALGMAAPLFLMAAFFDRLNLRNRRWLRGRALRLGPLRTHSTSLISGVLFAGIGVLFLLTDGTANLGGITTANTQFQLQSWIQNALTGIGDPLFLFVVAVVALTAVLIRIARAAR